MIINSGVDGSTYRILLRAKGYYYCHQQLLVITREALSDFIDHMYDTVN